MGANINLDVNNLQFGTDLAHINMDDDVDLPKLNSREVLRRVRDGLMARVTR
jgi:hypothetical protein